MTASAHLDVVAALRAIPDTDVMTASDAAFPGAVQVANLDTAPAQPLALVECTAEAAVGPVVRCVTTAGLPLSVRGGGYSVAGFGTVDAGIIASLRRLRHIGIGPQARTVRVGAGVTAGELDTALAPHGLSLNLPVPSNPSVIGAALSGGIGFTLRRDGFGSDAMIAARVVTADGSLVAADDSRTPDLMWALRGGGGNFGAVVEATFQARPVDRFTVAQGFYGTDDIPARLRFVRDWSAALPDEVTVVAMLRNLPPHPAIVPGRRGRPGLIVTAVHCGDESGADRALAPLIAQPSALHSSTMRLPPSALRAITDAQFPYRHFGIRGRSGWLDALADDVIDGLAAACGTVPPGHSLIEIAALGGAVAAPPYPGAAPGRGCAFLCSAMALWVDGTGAAPALEWLESIPVLREPGVTARGVIPGFVSADQLDATAATYGPDLARLRAVKRRYDPGNVFRRNLNVMPADPS